jgi:KDO2-lipid IV(A) lauroyltransferase
MVMRNVRRVLGAGADEAEVERVTRCIFHNLLKNYFDLFWLPAQPTHKIAPLIRLVDIENTKEGLKRGKGLICVSLHLGNQELMTKVTAITDLKVTAVAEHIKPESLFRYISSLRERDGVKLVAQDGALREIILCLKRNQTIGLAFDRDVTDSGRIINFFGAPAKLPDGYAILALKYGAAVTPIFILRAPGDRYEVRVETPMFFEGQATNDADVRRVMTSVGAVVEERLRQHIDQYVYFHYVWEEDKERARLEQERATAS